MATGRRDDAAEHAAVESRAGESRAGESRAGESRAVERKVPTHPLLPLPPTVGLQVRRPLLLSLARAVLNATTVILLYYLLPLNRGASRGTVGWLLGGLVLIALLVTWQIRAILRARYPGLRAVEALASSIPLFLVVFASAYEMMASADPGAFSQPLTRTDILYFVVTVFATVGFGDITPVTEAARVVVMVQMLGDLVLIGLVVRAFLAAATRGRAQRDQAGEAVREHRPREP